MSKVNYIFYSENNAFNLRDIILDGESFQLSTTQHNSDQSDGHIILLKPNEQGTVLLEHSSADSTQSIYDSGHTDQLAPVYVTGETNAADEVVNSSDLLESSVTTPYCLEESEQTVEVHEASTVVEFIVDSNTDEVVFEGSHEPETTDPLFP